MEPAGPKTRTSEEQAAVEKLVAKALDSGKPILHREIHSSTLFKGTAHLPSYMASLDASRPCLDLLDSLPASLGPRTVEWLKYLQLPTGGYGGGPMQVAHLAPTYAAVNSLIIAGTKEAYCSIDRRALYAWLLTLKDERSGGFRMHHDGEVDIRGTYCALAVAALVNIITPDLLRGVPVFLAACQTYEGGMGGYPGNEAHGGYTFCGIAAAVLAGAVSHIDVPRLLHWVSHRQMWPDHGFQGRTNKLVDSCYSFWQAAVFPILDRIAMQQTGKPLCHPELVRRWQLHAPLEREETEGENEEDDGDWLFDQLALQQYLLLAAQDPKGLFKDKPGKSVDPYHTCYALSGLSVAQNNKNGGSTVHGPKSNLIAAVDPVHNIRQEKVQRANAFFSTLPPPS